MKITIETEGKAPRIIENILGYQLIVTTEAETLTLGGAVEGIGLEKTMTMALAAEKLYRRFRPFDEMRKAIGEPTEEDGE